MRRVLLFVVSLLGAVSALALITPRLAHAQGGMMGRGGAGQNNTPTQSGPVQNRSVGPRAGRHDDEDDSSPPPSRVNEPSAATPADPLAIPPEVEGRIGTDADVVPPAPVGALKRTYFPYYQERKGDYRLTMVPPFYVEHIRGLRTEAPVPGEPTQEDRETYAAMLFYQRRSPDLDMDVIFPLAWHVRDKANNAWVLGPFAHREAPFEHDNWVAPLAFEGKREDGGYFHSPLLLTTSHWSKEKAFQLTALYFRDRNGADIDWGVAPFYFHGDNGNLDGNRRTYSLIPPLLYFHKEIETDESKITVIGPLILRSNPKRTITDVAPLFFHIEGNPDSGGIRESHTTLFPFFHYGWKDDETRQHLLVVPGFLRRTTATTDTIITPLISTATTRNGSTSLWTVGPVVPLVWAYRDRDIDQTSWAVLPLFYHSSSPQGLDWLTPVFGRFENYGVSRTYWTFPSLLVSLDKHGWETDLLPVAYVGRGEGTTHAVLAPLFWDFATTKGRTTIGVPIYWRFADSTDDTITQVAGNTLYLQKRVPGGIDSQFHVIPVFSYGEVPHGHWWNVLFGLTGYSHDTDGTEKIRLFWIPITTGHDDTAKRAAAIERGKDPAFHGARF